jgi:hypothetical protein
MGGVVEKTAGWPESLAGHLNPGGLQFDRQQYYVVRSDMVPSLRLPPVSHLTPLN